MKLSKKQIRIILREAEKLLGKNRKPDFTCVDFVREVYLKADIKLPLINPDKIPALFPNLSQSEIDGDALGKILFLKKKTTDKARVWTHVGIIFSENELVHCSKMFGNQVCTTPIQEVLEHYEIV